MKRPILGMIVLLMLIFTALPIYAATVEIKIDNVLVVSDVAPEMKNNRTMVPLRIISENLGAEVNFSNDQITLLKNGMEVIVKINSKEVIKNGEVELLDVAPYIKDKRTMVPLRFIAETFGATVDYKDNVISITTKPLQITADMIVADLLKHPELIPYEAVLGGVMSFYKETTDVLSDRWVFAYFEDGHINGNMLLEYSVKNGVISWKVIDSYLY